MEAPPMGIWVQSLARAGGIEAAAASGTARGRRASPARYHEDRRRWRARAAIGAAGVILRRLGSAVRRAGRRLGATAAEAPASPPAR